MTWFPFKIFSKNFLGIDIGTFSIKIVEVSKFGNRYKLENYGELRAEGLYEKPFRTFEKSTLLLSSQDIARSVSAILKEANIKTKKVAFSIPDFSSFFTWFNLPPVTEKEISQAVRYEARQHIPVPLSEVTLDWRIIEGKVSPELKSKVKILLVAVPNEVVNQYQEIANFCQLELQSLEAEVFGFSQSLVKNEKGVIVLIDIGARSTTCNIVDNGVLKRSHSFDVFGNQLTENISHALGISYNEAEKLKKKQGILQESSLREILLPLIDLILIEIKKTSKSFCEAESKKIEKIIIAGGTALLPGLKEYFAAQLKKETVIADPFSELFYPPILEKKLKKMGPSYAIAVGMALKGLK
jgi:type IV pilus assembly protein PilM